MRCLYCYKELENGETDFHPAYSRHIWGRRQPPLLEFSEDRMEELALQVVRSHIAVTGVQPKLSLDLAKKKGSELLRFTIAGLWGSYILKPPIARYPHLPEVEDLTMHLASIAGIATVPHSLIQLPSGNLAYMTRSIDRVNRNKLPMEDMCQLTGKLTEDKYQGSYEQVAKAIFLYSANPALDVVNFFQQVIFSFLAGNADMHLKNFSLIKEPGIGYMLTPAYDMVATALVNPADTEDLALTLNGKKKENKERGLPGCFRYAETATGNATESSLCLFPSFILMAGFYRHQLSFAGNEGSLPATGSKKSETIRFNLNPLLRVHSKLSLSKCSVW